MTRSRGLGARVAGSTRLGAKENTVPDESIHVYGAMCEGEVGIILALPADAAVRNPEGQTVPGIVLSTNEARNLAKQILSQVEHMERPARTER
jgi:hypothetical protein